MWSRESGHRHGWPPLQAAAAPLVWHDRETPSLRMSDWRRAVRDVRPTRLAGDAVWHLQHEKVMRMETATPHPLLVIAVVEDNPADVSCIARVLHAHGMQYVLQVLESSQRALHFFDRLAAQDGGGCPDLLLLDFTLPGVDMRELVPWMKALPVCRRLRLIVMTGLDDPAVEAEAHALGADAFFQKPGGFQRFLALGDLIKVVMFGHTQP